MSMLDRRSRERKARSGAHSGGHSESEPQTVPTSAGPDEETVRIAHRDFRRRRNAGRRRTVWWVLLAVLLAAVVAGAVWVVFFSTYVTARGVVVSGAGRTLTDLRIERAADVPLGVPLATVDLGEVRTRVEALPEVATAAVSRSWPDTVRIEVTARTPLAAVEGDQGWQTVDEDGVLFGRYPARPRGLPLLSTDEDTSDEALTEAGRVIAALPPSVSARVASIEVASVDEIDLVLRNGRRVVWGSAEDSKDKAEVLAVLLQRPGRLTGDEIDVSVPGRPTTR